MIIGSPKRRAARLCLGLALITLPTVACTDLPTGTDSFQLEADGQLWAAVVPPAGLPDASTWLAYSAPDANAEATRAEVLEWQRQAREARAVGDLARERAALSEATARAVSVMEIDPHGNVFIRGQAALESWQRSARSAVALATLPTLSEAVDAVAEDLEAVDAALEAGDVRGAALRMTAAADRIREWSPQGVALRVLDRVDARLAVAARTGSERERAAHLVQSARYELIGGNALRAMQRALYALQLASGNGLQEIPVQERSPCGEFGC